MKRLLLLLFLTLTTSIFSQEIKKTLLSINAYKYDIKGKEIENHHYNVINNIPEGPDKTFTSYNDNGTKNIIFTLNSLNDTSDTKIYSYENKKITILSYQYYGATSVPNTKIIYYGIKDNNEIKEIVVDYLFNIPMYKCDSFHIFKWNNEDWQESVVGKYTYNTYNNPTKIILTLNDYASNMPINLQITYQYDSKQNCNKMFVSILMYAMPLSLMNVEQTFNTSSQLTETYLYPNVNPLLSQYLGEDIEDILIEQKIKYTYNVNEKIETVSILTLDESSEKFIEQSRQEFVYIKKTIEGINQYLLDTAYTYKIEDPSSILSLTLSNILFYPNPASDFLTLDGIDLYSDIYIYNLGGKLLIFKQLNINDKSLYIGSLPVGMYIIKIKNKKEVYTSKFLKYSY